MRRLSDDEGATAVLVVITVVVLVGMAAMVVDVGALWNERRQLQNGADAGSLAVAELCAAGDCSGYLTEAQKYADDNSNDGASNVQDVCGSSPDNSLPACTDPPSPTPGGEGWVMVETQTGTNAGPGVVPSFLAQVLVSGYNGETVHASSIANWGAPSGISGGLPVTFSYCEWSAATAGGVEFAPPPPYSAPGPLDQAGNTLEREIWLHDTSVDDACYPGVPNSDMPGDFGWLDETNCQTTTNADGTLSVQPGNGSVPHQCSLSSLLNSVIYIPVFDWTNGASGNQGTYTVHGYAAFYLTGYRVPGDNHASTVTGTTCQSASSENGNQAVCLIGYFTHGLVPQGGTVSSDPSVQNMGATVVGLAP